jgi:hypothetical protein
VSPRKEGAHHRSTGERKYSSKIKKTKEKERGGRMINHHEEHEQQEHIGESNECEITTAVR